MDTYTDLYSQVKQDGHNLIEKLRKPVGNLGVPREFTLATRFIKECLENLYDEKNLVDDQWHLRQDHLKKTLNFRLFQRDTNKVGTHQYAQHKQTSKQANKHTITVHERFYHNAESYFCNGRFSNGLRKWGNIFSFQIPQLEAISTQQRSC